ncbi:MAG: exonuclease SbcCD subunit D [Candidatus Kapaibacterium sp.]|jgi:DNA repair exonuclease SbcCD nuclease subunit|nr:exonuclease SbcCD subunit D [Candidatus Kapabacteria bacterium]
MKILHCADIHLGRRIAGAAGEFSEIRYNDYFRAFEYIIDQAINLKVDVFVVAGDLFDKREITPEILDRCEKLFLKLYNKNIITLVIEGNHDNIKSGKEHESWIYYLESRNLVRRPHYNENDGEFDFNPIIIGNVRFFGLGYPGFFADELLGKLSENLTPDDNFINYVIIHTALAHPDFMMGTIKHETVNRLIDKVNYIAGGHFHEYFTYPKDNPVFFIPGSPEMWDLNEFRQQKGFIIFDTEDNSKEFHEVVNRRKVVIELKLNHSNLSESYMKLFEEINITDFSNNPICYLVINYEERIHFDTGELENLIIQKGAIKVIVKNNIKQNRKTTGSLGLDSTVSEIESEIISSWDYYSGSPDDSLRLLEQMKSFQIEGLEDDFKDYYDLFLEKLLSDGGNDN